MKLGTIARLTGARMTFSDAGVRVRGLAEDSRRVRRGDLFFCLKGSRVDGALFARDAVRRGAAAVMTQGRPLAGIRVPQLTVKDVRKALADTAHAFYGHPSRRLKVVGVTGTKGKTTVTYLLRSLLEAAGRRCGLIGTISYETARRSYDAPNTTPSALTVARLMAEMVRAGCRWCAMEVSSHALDMERVRGVRFRGAVFTNLGPEHLDYHRTMARYFAAKKRLFLDPDAPKVRAVNGDDRWGRKLIALLKKERKEAGRTRSYGISGPFDFKAEGIWVSPERLRFRVMGREFEAPLTGVFNVYNALSAVAVLKGLGLPWQALQRGLAKARAVPGRLETIRGGQDFTVLVDYAHAPNALEEALKTARELAGESRLICVFGCGGDRDRTKRPLMGGLSARWADTTVLTNDNPRTEDPGRILREILRGVPREALRNGHRRVRVVPDRSRAIHTALRSAGTGDVVLIAGKGHETYQVVGERKRHFDDREEARKALKALKR